MTKYFNDLRPSQQEEFVDDKINGLGFTKEILLAAIRSVNPIIVNGDISISISFIDTSYMERLFIAIIKEYEGKYKIGLIAK